MDSSDTEVVDELARVIFAVMERFGLLKPPAPIAVMQGMSGGPRRTASRSATVWQDDRPEARRIVRGQR